MIEVEKLTKKTLAALLDSTYLKAFGGPEKIEALCREAAELGFASVAVNGGEVARCAELLRKNGFTDVVVTKGSGDFGLDILCEREGVTYGIQCKRYDKPIGVFAVQQTYAGRDYYGRMVGAVMTNQYFTEAAVRAAKKLNIMLWDRGYLDEMER